MRLAVAAGILSQALPVISESGALGQNIPSSLVNEGVFDLSLANEVGTDRVQKLGNELRLGQNVQSQKGNGALRNRVSESIPKMCDPLSSDPDVGVLSCGLRSTCTPSSDSSLGGLCEPRQSKFLAGLKNLASEDKTHTKNCDPSADVGVLACGSNEVCQVDQDSETGGICVDGHSRKLDSCSICPGGHVGNYFDVVTIPSLGEYTCGEVYYFNYVLEYIPDAYCTLLYTITHNTCCVDGAAYDRCNVCEDGILTNAEGNVTFADGSTTSCASIYWYGVMGLIGEQYCSYYADVAQSCCGAVPTCDLCPGGHISNYFGEVSANGYSYTCGELFSAAIAEYDRCSTLSALAAESCCVAGDAPHDVCDPCQETGWGDYSGIVDIPGSSITCRNIYVSGALGLVGEAACAVMTQYGAPCCASSCDFGCANNGTVLYPENTVNLAGVDWPCSVLANAGYSVDGINDNQCSALIHTFEGTCCDEATDSPTQAIVATNAPTATPTVTGTTQPTSPTGSGATLSFKNVASGLAGVAIGAMFFIMN